MSDEREDPTWGTLIGTILVVLFVAFPVLFILGSLAVKFILWLMRGLGLV